MSKKLKLTVKPIAYLPVILDISNSLEFYDLIDNNNKKIDGYELDYGITIAQIYYELQKNPNREEILKLLDTYFDDVNVTDVNERLMELKSPLIIKCDDVE